MSRSSAGGPPVADETVQARTRAAGDDRVVTVHGQGIEAEVVLPKQGRVVLGRSAEAGLRLEHASISREHAALEVRGGRVLLRDLGSRNGTRVLGERLEPGREIVLRPGVVAEVGELILLLRGPQPGAADAPAEAWFGEGMRKVLDLADRVAADEITVLLLGETGVGKEVLTERIHARSRRAQAPLLRLHCAALASSVLESELFGHEKGAFTGAGAAKPGLLETAQGGTVFIDEVGELPAEVQVKLLRVIEERRVLPVGGLKPRPIDVRFVAATNRDLRAEIARGAFRQDLYYRLAGVTITVPPLRERADEIPVLARRFLEQASAERERPVPELSEAALAALSAHDWPGNVRELKSTVVRALLLSDGRTIEAEHVRPGAEPPAAPGPRVAAAAPSAERDRILLALERTGGNQKEAARVLGISRRSLLYRLDELDIARPRKRPTRGG